jgi:septal ring factor EnvC (AmiA/AmiB activator)
MKKIILILCLFSFPLFAQEKKEPVKQELTKEEKDLKAIEAKVNELTNKIIKLQSDLYEGEKQLKALYDERNIYVTALNIKKEKKEK